MEEVGNPYAAPVAPVGGAVPPPLPGERRCAPLAGRGERLLARIADRLLYFLCFLPLLIVVIAGARNMIGITAVLGGFAMAGLFVYNLMLLGDGQTVAKRWLRIRIVRSDGTTAELGRILGLRMFLPWLLGVFLGPLFVLPDLLCIFGNEKRCLHDLMADTVVVEA